MLIPKLPLQKVLDETGIPRYFLTRWAIEHNIEKYGANRGRLTYTFSPYQVYQIKKDWQLSQGETWEEITNRLKGRAWDNHRMLFR